MAGCHVVEFSRPANHSIQPFFQSSYYSTHPIIQHFSQPTIQRIQSSPSYFHPDICAISYLSYHYTHRIQSSNDSAYPAIQSLLYSSNHLSISLIKPCGSINPIIQTFYQSNHPTVLIHLPIQQPFNHPSIQPACQPSNHLRGWRVVGFYISI